MDSPSCTDEGHLTADNVAEATDDRKLFDDVNGSRGVGDAIASEEFTRVWRRGLVTSCLAGTKPAVAC